MNFTTAKSIPTVQRAIVSFCVVCPQHGVINPCRVRKKGLKRRDFFFFLRICLPNEAPKTKINK